MKKINANIVACLLLFSLFLLQGCNKMDSGENSWPGKPSAPENLQVAIDANGGGILHWSQVDNASSYKIYYSTNKGGPYQWLATSYGPFFTIPEQHENTVFYVVVTSVNDAGESSYSKELTVDLSQSSAQYVTITDKNTYFAVTLDLQAAGDHYALGRQYGTAIVNALSSYRQLLDSYISDAIGYQSDYETLIQRALTIKQNIPKEYQDEMEGLASTLSNTTSDTMGDGLLSKDEIYLFNLLPDVYRATQCSGLGVFGPYSETGSTIMERTLDWFGGYNGQIDRMQAVVNIRNGANSIYLIGYLGYVGVVSGFNNDKIFAGIMDSPSGEPYDINSRRSYPMDLRYALENQTTLDGVATYMTDTSRSYAFNHLIFLSDPSRTAVVENNFSGTGTNMHRALRTYDSQLNDGITWGFNNAVAAVNCFMLKGNHNNYSGSAVNSERWQSFKSQLSLKGDTVSVNEIKEIASYDGGDGPGQMSDGDLYNEVSRQIIIFQPQTLSLEIFFAPKSGNGVLPQDPTFESVSVSFN